MPSHDHHDRSHDPSSASWDALGPASSDDFWGDVPEWSATASTSRRSGRGRIGAGDELVDPTPIGHQRPVGQQVGHRRDDDDRQGGVHQGGVVSSIRSAWDQLLSGGADVTREHRRVDLTSDLDAADRRDVETDRHVAPPRNSAPAPFDHELDDDAAVSLDDDSPIRTIESNWIHEARRAEQRPRGPIDPLLARIGAVVIVATLVLPLLVSLVGGDDLDTTLETFATASETPGEQVVTAPESVPATSASTAPLDPESLPRAVPVNTDPPSIDASTAAATATSTTPASEAASSASTAASASVESSASTSNGASGEIVEPAAADSPATRVDPPECPVAYTVVAGDFWLRLADAADVGLADLLAVNNATTDTPLYPGSEICLPAGATTPAPPATTTPATTTPPTTAAPTTTPPTTTAPTTVAPIPEPQGPDDIKQIIRDVFPDHLEAKALDIAYRESRYVPTAKNWCCYGLFQIYWEVHDVWLDDLGITSASQLYDPETNARAALALYERAGGWHPWTTA